MPVVIQAAFARQSSTSDGGYRISFDTHMAEEVVKVQEMREEALIIVVMTQQEYDTNSGEAQ
jgi:hypothetical protein